MVRQFIKRKMTYGLRSAIRNVLNEIRIFRSHRLGVCRARQISNQEHLRLHIGCGPKPKKGWINIDLSPHADLTLDMREALPFRDNSCSMVYSEHFFEHLDYPLHAKSFLKEYYRVLEPGGLFSVGVPDTAWPIDEYAGIRQDNFFKIGKERHWHPEWCRTKMEQINYHFRQNGEHRFAYDLVTLVQMMRDAGFQEIKQRDFDPQLDSADRELGTLYVNAIKPAIR